MPDLTDLFTPEFHRNPYEIYRAFREQGALLDLGVGSYVATSHELVREAFRRPDLRAGMGPDYLASGGGDDRWAERSPSTWRFATQAMLFRNGADHTRLRKLVSKAFTPRRVLGLRDRVERLVDELLDGLVERGEMDLVQDFAYPLPLVVIAELLGIPSEDREQLKRWSQPLTMILDGMTREHALEEAEVAARQLDAYLLDQFEAHRQNPGDGLIDGLLAAHDEGDRLSDDELAATCTLILVAGHETTTNLLGNGVLALMQQREAWLQLRAEPDLVPSAVEELLRFDSPVQFTARRTIGELEFGGETIADDQEIVLVLGAANRDPARFDEPDRLILDRGDNDHVAFGLGQHFCLGASLARTEAQAAFAGLARRLPGLELAADPETLGYRPGFAIRALEKLPVRW